MFNIIKLPIYISLLCSNKITIENFILLFESYIEQLSILFEIYICYGKNSSQYKEINKNYLYCFKYI